MFFVQSGPISRSFVALSMSCATGLLPSPLPNRPEKDSRAASIAVSEEPCEPEFAASRIKCGFFILDSSKFTKVHESPLSAEKYSL
jgi:hypothetical protein